MTTSGPGSPTSDTSDDGDFRAGRGFQNKRGVFLRTRLGQDPGPASCQVTHVKTSAVVLTQSKIWPETTNVRLFWIAPARIDVRQSCPAPSSRSRCRSKRPASFSRIPKLRRDLGKQPFALRDLGRSHRVECAVSANTMMSTMRERCRRCASSIDAPQLQTPSGVDLGGHAPFAGTARWSDYAVRFGWHLASRNDWLDGFSGTTRFRFDQRLASTTNR